MRVTAELLIEGLGWLRHQGLLDVAALRCLPLDRAKFAEDFMFAPLFEATKNALTNGYSLARATGTQARRNADLPARGSCEGC